MQLWAVLFPTVPPSKNLRNSHLWAIKCQLFWLLSCTSDHTAPRRLNQLCLKEKQMFGVSCQSLSAVGDSENTFANPNGKAQEKNFRPFSWRERVQRNGRKGKSCWETRRKMGRPGGREGHEMHRRGAPDCSPKRGAQGPHTPEQPVVATDDGQNGNLHESPVREASGPNWRERRFVAAQGLPSHIWAEGRPAPGAGGHPGGPQRVGIQGNQESAAHPRRPRLSVITTDLSKARGTGQACTESGENQILPKGLLQKQFWKQWQRGKTIFFCRPQQRTLGYFFTMPFWESWQRSESEISRSSRAVQHIWRSFRTKGGLSVSEYV